MEELWFNKVGNSPIFRNPVNRRVVRPTTVTQPTMGEPIGPTIRTDEQKKEDSKKMRESFIKCFDEYKIPECVKDYYLAQEKWRSERPDISSLLQGPVNPTMDAQIQKIMGEHFDKQPKASKCAQDFLTSQEQKKTKNKKVSYDNIRKHMGTDTLNMFSNITGAGCEGGVSCNSCSTCGGGCKYADCRNGCCMQKMTSSRSLRSDDRFTNMDGRGLRRDSSLKEISYSEHLVPKEIKPIIKMKLKTCDELWAQQLTIHGGKLIPATESECLQLCVENASGKNAIKNAEAQVKRLEENYGELVAGVGKEQADIKIANAKAMICVLKRTIKARCDVHKKTFLDKYKFWILGGIGAYLLLKK
jgi:hypothetical protein